MIQRFDGPVDMLATVGNAKLIVAERLRGAVGRWADVSVRENAKTISFALDVGTEARAGEAWHYSRSLRLDIALAHPAACTLSHVGRGPTSTSLGWDLCSGDSREHGPFREVFWWCSDELFHPEVSDDAEAVFDHQRRTHNAHEHLEAICQLAADRAIKLCDPVARERVMRLPADSRFFVYDALLTDTTGRVDQMIDICPGLLTLAAACDRTDSRIWELITGVALGRKLAELIELVLPLASDSCRAFGVDGRLSRDAVAFVKRAPPMCAQNLLRVLHAPGIDLNDLIRAHDCAEAWFEMMAGWGTASRTLRDPRSAARLGGFFSKHGLELLDDDFPCMVVEEVIHWLEHANAPVPSRSSSPRRIRGAVDNWHATLHHRVEHDPATPLAKGPVASHEVAGIEAHPIETVGQLVREGLEMGHCVAAFADAAISGMLFLHRGVIAGARVTIAITGRPGIWQLHEVAGMANRRLHADELAAVERWIVALR